MKRLVVAAMAALTLAGCEIKVIPELYLSDLRDVFENDSKGLTTPVTIAVQVPSTEKCAEYTAQISDVLTGILDNFETRGCAREDMSSWLNLEAQIPLGKNPIDVSSVFYVSIQPVADMENGMAVCLYIDPGLYQLLNERMEKEFHQQIDLAKSAIGMTLNNDEKGSVAYWVKGVFLNGAPVYQNWTEFSLARRKSVELLVSNVGSASLETARAVCPLLINI